MVNLKDIQQQVSTSIVSMIIINAICANYEITEAYN